MTLALDAAIQDKAEEVLQKVGAKFRPKGATAVVMDPRTGEVLANANWPRVDANDVASAPTTPSRTARSASTTSPARRSRRSPVAGALEAGEVTPDTTFDLPPQIQVADRTIGESHPRGYVTLTTAEILAQSSNVGAIKIGMKLGPSASTVGAPLRLRRADRRRPPGEEAGQVLAARKYSGSSMGNLPIGQGVSVTPMQMASAYAAIANGGVLRPARIVRKVDGAPPPTPAAARDLAADAPALRDHAQGRARRRAARRARRGRPATSSRARPAPRTRSTRRRRVLREPLHRLVRRLRARREPAAAGPVMVDEPNGGIYGGDVAAPAFQQITSFALNYLRIPPE
jgi:cell division protein FtsI/penicillin-binding protein 2